MVDLCRGPSSHPHFSSQFIPIFQSIALTDSGNIHRFLFSVFGNQHASNLILDCRILSGNPADSTLTREMLERQEQLYGRPPLKVALDGGFASHENLETAKQQGITDVCFAKGRGLEEEDMCRSSYVYKALRKFRAGIESGISWLKRSFGLNRCVWKGLESFKSYVWASIVSANLLTLARYKLAEA
jgi:IS5 family transposase